MMRRLLAVAMLSGAAVSGPVHSATQALHPCRVPGLQTEVQCGVVQRALDPAHPQLTQIDVHYVVVPALARRKLPDPVFFLAGGPGQSAIGVAPMIAHQMNRLHNRRDLVFVDQRGTGKSAPLMCDDDRKATLSQGMDRKRRDGLLRQCLVQLQKLPYGDLRFFTTTLAMQDVDAVRLALGAASINLVGASYGTRAALEYMRAFPQAVRRSVIDGVAPPDMALPASASTDNQAAFDALLGACEQEVKCASTFPQLRADWNRMLASLPKGATVVNPFTGVSEQLTLTRETLLGGVRMPLYSPVTASALPQAISEAAQGHFEALLALGSGSGARGANRMAEGMHFSVVCAEDMPRLNVTADQPGRDFGAEFGQFYIDTCSYWPRGSVASGFYSIPVSAAPVLVLSGGIDPVTPARHGARVAQALGSMARHVVVPQAGHVVMGLGCMHDVLFRFIDTIDAADAMKVDTGCAVKIPRPPAFVPIARADQGAT